MPTSRRSLLLQGCFCSVPLASWFCIADWKVQPDFRSPTANWRNDTVDFVHGFCSSIIMHYRLGRVKFSLLSVTKKYFPYSVCFTIPLFISSKVRCCNVRIKECYPCFYFLKVVDYTVTSSVPLGRVILVRLEKQKYLVEDNWYCSYVNVTPAGGKNTQSFPCYCWFVGDVTIEIRDGTGQSLPQ